MFPFPTQSFGGTPTPKEASTLEQHRFEPAQSSEIWPNMQKPKVG